MQHSLLNIAPKMLALTVTNGRWKLKAPTQNPPILEHTILFLFPVALHQQFINLSTIIRLPFTARPRKAPPPCRLRRHNHHINFNSSTTTLCDGDPSPSPSSYERGKADGDSSPPPSSSSSS